ncbi:hypothetical protein IQ268_16000 [Oculatella sp. LEGE 06141]|nr:hypothetical protein [Oculatella sp. LEGE 06141]
MNRRVLGGGAIACSAMVISGLAQPSTPEQNVTDCDNSGAKATSSWLPQQLAQGQCQLSSMIPTINNVPEFLRLGALWGNLRASVVPDEMETVYGKLLEEAQAAASNDRLAEAIANIIGIPKNSRHYDMAQQLQEDWSQELLQQAANHYQQAQTTTAISMLNAIPPTSERYGRAIELRTIWNQEAALFAQAKIAKNAGDWRGVIDTLRSLDGSLLYHSLPAQELLQQAMNKLFEADESWIQLASKSADELSAAAGMPTLSSTMNGSLPLSVDPIPKRSSLPIALEQAMKWAQPQVPSAEAKPNTRTRKATSTSSSTSSTTVAPKPSIIPPESAIDSLKEALGNFAKP